jgi:dCMP deaminase
MTRPTKDEMMMAHAEVAARMSTCRRRQVGCALTDERHEQLATGYNGSWRGGPNGCPRPAADGACGCLHAEVNAAIKCLFRPWHAYVTVGPCEGCATALVNAGVRRVVYLGELSASAAGLELLRSAGVEVVRLGERPCRT